MIFNKKPTVFEGKIYSCNEKDDIFKYLITKGSKIVYTGDTLPDQFKNHEIHKNKVIVPGLIDTHIHLLSYSYFDNGLDIRSEKSIPQIQETIKKYIKDNKNKIIIGFGFPEFTIEEKRHITMAELDSIETSKGIMLVRYDGHGGYVNSNLLKLVNIPFLAETIKKNDGYVSSLSFYQLVTFLMGKMDSSIYMERMKKTCKKLPQYGITMVNTVEGIGRRFDDFMFSLIRFFYTKPICVKLTLQYFKLPMPLKILTKLLSLISKRLSNGIVQAQGGCFYTAADGSCGTLDAAFDDKEHLPHSHDELVRYFTKIHKSINQIRIHAIGSAAFDLVANAYSELLEAHPRPDHRHTIIHSCFPTEEGLKICKKHNIILEIQPEFLHWEQEPMDFLKKQYGDIIDSMLPLRTIEDLGVVQCGGSDAPCTYPNPITGIYSACNHPRPQQSLSFKEALKLYTYNAAWSLFEEHNRGSLENGKLADFVILNIDPESVDVSQLKNDLFVKETYIKGKKVY